MKIDVKSEFFTKNAPPGINLEWEYFIYKACLILSVIFSMLFFYRYMEARQALYTYIDSRRVLIEGAEIDGYFSVLNVSLAGFFFAALIIIPGFVSFHYQYYRQGSMSIYTMKRLPNKFEMHRRAVFLPLLAALSLAAAAALLMLLYFLIYVIATPKQCLPW